MKTASYTVMLTDIKGFTERTSQQTRQQNERLLLLHDALLSPVFRGYRGRRIKSLGDAYLVIFDSATRALACGAAIQDRLAAYNRQVPEDEAIHVKIALSAGELRVEGHDVFGEAVNLASRVETRTEAGEVCFTESVLLLCERGFFDYEELGPQRFKGVAEPVRLYRLVARAGEEAPYGDEALGALGLEAPDPRRLSRRRWSLPRHVVRGGVALAAVGGVAVLGAWSHDTLWGPLASVERRVAAGELEAAEALLDAMGQRELTPAKIGYLRGRILEEAGEREQAVEEYRAAGEGDEALGAQRVAPRLIGLLEDGRCEVRAAAARALGELGPRSATAPLRALAARELEGVAGLGVRTGCDPGGEARRALEKMGATG